MPNINIAVASNNMQGEKPLSTLLIGRKKKKL
jgi:hypothetical protein